MKAAITEEQLRRHYASTAFASMGVPFERGMQLEPVRILVDGAARAEERGAADGGSGGDRGVSNA